MFEHVFLLFLQEAHGFDLHQLKTELSKCSVFIVCNRLFITMIKGSSSLRTDVEKFITSQQFDFCP